MKVITTIAEMVEVRQKLQLQNKTVGFVPTMGYLHDGHLKLINTALKQNDVVIVSIFVNPLQFNQNSDLESYPRDLQRDEAILTSTVSILFFIHLLKKCILIHYQSK